MKQAIKTTRMITMGLFTFCTMGLSHTTYAGVTNAGPIEFKFIGKVENHPVFQLSLNNDGTEVYFIRIKDANNEALYFEKVKASEINYTRNYRLAMDDARLGLDGVKVEVTSGKTHKTQVYRVSLQKTLKEEIIVAKL